MLPNKISMRGDINSMEIGHEFGEWWLLNDTKLEAID